MHYNLCHLFLSFFCFLVRQTVKIVTIENLNVIKKTNGPKIYICSHPSTLDPFYFYPYLNRPIILMTQFVFNMPVIGWIVKNCGFIPVPLAAENKPKRSTYLNARWALLDGYSILIAPEGQLTKEGSFENAKTGAVRLSMETGTPIIPIGLSYNGEVIERKVTDSIGHQDIMKICWGGDYHVKFGEPIYLKSRTDPREATDFVMNKVKELM